MMQDILLLKAKISTIFIWQNFTTYGPPLKLIKYSKNKKGKLVEAYLKTKSVILIFSVNNS